MSFLSKIFGQRPDYAQLIAANTPIIDVRSAGEYAAGALPGSHNIPLDKIREANKRFDMDQTLIVVCASGMRSGMAKRILKSSGFSTVHNGGSWGSLIRYFPD